VEELIGFFIRQVLQLGDIYGLEVMVTKQLPVDCLIELLAASVLGQEDRDRALGGGASFLRAPPQILQAALRRLLWKFAPQPGAAQFD
jgi:hypothetical protein